MWPNKVSPPPAPSILGRIGLLLASLAIFGAAAEAYFRFIRVQSDGFAVSRASRRWEQRYWKPLNSLGYRDAEHLGTDLAEKKVLFFVGDSVVAGYGVKNPQDRMSAVLGKGLGPDWRVVVIADKGWDTSQELAAVQSYGWRPDAIVLLYFLNDIQGAADKTGALMKDSLPDSGSRLLAWSQYSFFLDFIYWRLFGVRLTLSSDRYKRRILDAYSDGPIWAEHRRVLERFVRFAGTQRAKLVVLVLPFLASPKDCIPAAERVTSEFRRLGAHAIDLTPSLIGRDSRSLIVNPLDHHPNETVHAEIASRLLRDVPFLRRQQGQ